MKRLLAWLLTLAMAVSLLPAALAETADATDALPQVGDTVHGFTVKEIRDFPLLGATMVLFEHDKTGAGLTYLANEDTNRVFDLTFLTWAVDNTGLPHVFEHATLNGSEKYPSSALFFNLSYQTYNTFMNAMTGDRMTTYPVASLSEAQLLRYADFYTDSCLHPMIMEDESIYREEAWRYRMASADAPLTMEGTVYSEMLGALDLARMAHYNAKRTAFPGSVAGNISGGDPDFIPDMTWQMLKDYHDRFYHPSNCMAYLYGQFDHYSEFLALLDEAFAPYERREISFEDSGYTPLTAPAAAEYAFPVEAGSQAENGASVYYTIVCPGLKDNPEEELVLNTLTDVLVADGSPLKLKLREAYPSAKLSCYIDTDGPEAALVFSAESMNRGDGEGFRAAVDAALSEVAEKGFADELVEGVMAQLNLDIRLSRENASVGVNMIPSIANLYASSGNPFAYPDYVDALGRIEAWNREGRYQEAVAKWLVGSQTCAVATTYPEPGAKETKDAALADRLAEVKAGMGEEEISAVVTASNQEKETKDASEYVKQLQAVTVASLPEEMKLYDITDTVGEDGVRMIEAKAGVDGIGSVKLLLDAAALPQEDLHWFSLFTNLMGELPTDKHSREELDVLMSRYLYNREIRLSLTGKGEGFHPYLNVSWIATDEDQPTSYELVKEILFGTDFSDTEELAKRISAVKAALKSSINGGVYNVQLYRAFAVTNPMYRYYTYFSHLEYYAFLEQVEQLMETQPEAVAQKLQQTQAFFHSRTGAVAAFAGNEASIEASRALTEAFFADMDAEAREPVTYELPSPAAREAVVVDSGVQFNLLASDEATLGIQDQAGTWGAVTSLVTDKLLMPLLREQYGVYTPLHSTQTDAGMYILAYRDPNIAETYAVYDQLAELVEGLELDQETLDGYILSSYSRYALSQGELSGALNAISNALNGDPQDRNLTYMRQLKAVTPETVKASAAVYRTLAEKGVRMTGGSAAKIKENADLYEQILTPFGSTETNFADVPADSPLAGPVAKVLSYGLMAAESEESFGVEAPATAAELAGALMTLATGQPMDGQEALTQLAGVGVMSGLQPDDVLTHGQCDQALVAFLTNVVGATGVEADPENETTNLPMNRGELAEQLAMLLQMFGM